MKELHVSLTDSQYALFMRALPGRGERTAYLRRCISIAIKDLERREEVLKKTDEQIERVLRK